MEIHCCAANPPPKSRPIAGSATLTAVESTAAIVEARIALMRASRFVDAEAVPATLGHDSGRHFAHATGALKRPAKASDALVDGSVMLAL